MLEEVLGTAVSAQAPFGIGDIESTERKFLKKFVVRNIMVLKEVRLALACSHNPRARQLKQARNERGPEDMGAIAKKFIVRRMTRQLDILESNSQDVACIPKFLANAMLKSDLEESFATPRSILVRLPVNAHALFMGTRPR